MQRVQKSRPTIAVVKAARENNRPKYITTYPRCQPKAPIIARPDVLAMRIVYAAWLWLVWAMMSAAAARGLAMDEAIIAGIVLASIPWMGRGLWCKS